MKRVLLLVCMIVSVVQLDWEREWIYVLSSAASLLLILYGELMRHRRVQREGSARPVQAPEFPPSEPSTSDPPHLVYRSDRIDNEPSIAARQLSLSTTNPMPTAISRYAEYDSAVDAFRSLGSNSGGGS